MKKSEISEDEDFSIVLLDNKENENTKELST